MALMQTQTGVNEERTQSVYVTDADVVKVYPENMSKDQINFDLHTTVRRRSPADYFVNFVPLMQFQQAWQFIERNGAVKQAVQMTPPAQIVRGVGTALALEKEWVEPAFKLITQDPEFAFGLKPETTPDVVAKTYQPWLKLWRESTVGAKLTGLSDKALSDLPLPVGAIPWFFAEFMPTELLEFGTKASNWIGLYGTEVFGPPLLNTALSKLPPRTRTFLMKDLFKHEQDLAADFETLGLSMNAKTSDVIKTYKQAARVTHPDLGGDPQEFVMVKTAYENIMSSRSRSWDKLFDYFRKSDIYKYRTTATQADPRGIRGLLASESGQALIPFGEGDLVRVGDQIGQLVKIVGQTASVNLAGRVIEIAMDAITPIPGVPADEATVNLERLDIADDAKIKIRQATEGLSKTLENQIGKPLKHEEVIKAAQQADLLTQGVSREATLKFEAALLKTREHLAALAEQKTVTPEFLDTLRIVANTGTDIARNLESFKIQAMPEFAAVKVKVVKDLLKLDKSSEDILEASKGVDFTDEQAVAKFYRKFVKPTLAEQLDEFAYMNILSSPLTHIVNTLSNVIQFSGLNPLTKLASGGVDFIATHLMGHERAHYISEVPLFYKGALNAFPRAFRGAIDIMRGKKTMERPDVKHIPTLSKLVDWATLKVGKYFIRALEASDIFFSTMIQGGEIEALSKSLGHIPNDKEIKQIEKQAAERANYYVFRQKPDPEGERTGQGKLLSALDQMTLAVYRFRTVPGLKWFVRFVQTPMNILKQGIEYSPTGFFTLPGAKDKTEQMGKAIIGSLVFGTASWLAANNLTTWSAPTGEQEKNDFYAAGLQPYSIRLGDTWVSYSKIGPLAYPVAMAAALHYFMKDSPNALSDSDLDKIVDALTGLLRFFSDQSYMRGIGDLADFARGEKVRAVISIPTQLIPLSSLQGWVNQIIDELQRKPETGLSIESMVDQLQMKILGMSRFVPAQLDREALPIQKRWRRVNAVLPVRASQVNRGALAEYREQQQIKQLVRREQKLSKKELENELG